MFSLGKKFLSHVLPEIMTPLRILWNEIIAFLFICFAIFAAPKVYTSWRGFDGEPGQLFRLIISSAFLFTMLIYGLFSFIRAKKISRTRS
jgi:type VI protein secretion system component VasK